MNNDESLISIILPVHNPGHHLKPCINSILSQKYVHWELLILDDASTDGSAQILDQISDPRIKVFRNETNQGPSICRNFLIGKSSGKYIALQDADDLMDPNRLLMQKNALLKFPEISVVGSYMSLISDDGRLLGHYRVDNEHFTVIGMLFRKKAPAHATLMGHKDWFIRNPYPATLVRAEDKFMIVNAIRCNDFSYMTLKQSLYLYRFQSSLDPRKKLMAYRAERSHLVFLLDNFFLRLAYIGISILKTTSMSISLLWVSRGE